MKTKMTDAQKIQKIVARHEDAGWTFYARYSGRCMFGQTCPGIVCPGWDVKEASAAVRRAIKGASPSLDSMGRDMIVYFPGLQSDPDTACPSCGEPEEIISSSGVCGRCTEAAYDSYAS